MLRESIDLSIEDDDLSTTDLKCLDMLSKDTNIKINDHYALEWLQCRRNPLYFIQNYVYIEETGGMRQYSEEMLRPKLRRVVRVLNRYHKCVFMASRQLGKSTIAACILAWSTIFFPYNKPLILNFRKGPAIKNLAMVKFVINNLPDWLRWTCVQNTKSERLTYLELRNGSRLDSFYPSSTAHPSTIARSLTSSCLYIDEAAFIPHMREIFGSAQQTLATAKDQAISNNYPYFQFVTSTPNGIAGNGEWFYDRWSKAVDSEDMFIADPDDPLHEDWRSDVDIDEIAHDESKNSFIKVQYHWSEDPRKTEKWYKEQCQELSDQRKINQELDLIFVGTSNCIFDDDQLSKLEAVNSVQNVPFKYGSTMKVFSEYIDPLDYYLIGVDTARSIKGAFNAIQIFSFKDFNQIAEIGVRLGSFAKYGDIIHEVFQWLYRQVGPRIILAIEKNTIGLAPIEHLLYHVREFDYSPFMYSDNDKEPGIMTTGISKDMMIGCLKEAIDGNPKCIKSQELINQMSSIERSSAGTIRSNSFSDLFMAACFCAYTRKRKALEIMPMLNLSNREITNNFSTNMRELIGLSDPKKGTYNPRNASLNPDLFITTGERDMYDIGENNYGNDPDVLPFMPFFGG
jgi:hypothetical protein